MKMGSLSKHSSLKTETFVEETTVQKAKHSVSESEFVLVEPASSVMGKTKAGSRVQAGAF